MRAPGVSELVQGFSNHIRSLKSSVTTEAAIRQSFIDPFWRALGWDVGDSQMRGPSLAEVLIEKTVETAEAGGLRSRRPDYIFRLGGFPRFIVEAKKPAVAIETDKDAIFQAKQYAWNSTIPFTILTNFERVLVYDTTLKPIHEEPHRGRIPEFSLHFSDYETQWDTLLETFGRAAVEAGSLESLLATVKKIRSGRRIRTVDRMLIDLKGAEPVDRVFLSYLDTHRRHLAAAIYSRNKAAFPDAETLHGAARLTEAVQRVMDRIVFMRACEDRDIIPYGTVRETLDRVRSEGGDFFTSLTARFREMDQDYNGYLFKPHFSEALRVDGNVLADFIRNLYPPEGPWDFAAIGDDILGIVYERFLGNVVTVADRRAVINEKPEGRHAGGVYYTPRFVVDSIIRRVVGPKLKGKTPLQVLDVKILDPACGSGSFLVAALQYLFDHCLAVIHARPELARTRIPTPIVGTGAGTRGRKKNAEIAFQDSDGTWNLAPDFRAALLTHCIHGVDIDQQAVEVTVMSLYLKLLEAKLPRDWSKLWVEKQLLPALDNNIRCGNSLIDEEGYFQYRESQGLNQQSLFDQENPDTAFRINRFDWASRTRGFGRLLDTRAVQERGRSGFDCVIGNPPYIRVQELNKWAPEECEFYKWRYTAAKKGNYDIYVVFTERALELLAPDGLLGFIMPHKFWQAKYGEGLRKIIADGKHLRGIVDFAHQQVFHGATTYTAIHILGREPNKKRVLYAKFDELTDGVMQCANLDARGRAEGVATFDAPMPSGEEPWRIASPAAMRVYEAIASIASITLSEAASRLYQGIRTSKNEVFVLRVIDAKRGKFLSDLLDHEVELEQGLLKPFLDGDCIRRYFIEPATAVAIFPYSVPKAGGGADLLAAEEISKKYPKTWEYLKKCEKVLRARENGAMDKDSWYAYGRTQNLDLFGIPRVLVPDMMDCAAFSLDEEGEAAFVSGYGIILEDKYKKLLAYFTGLLNSALLSEYLKSVSTPLRGGWYRTFPQFLRQIPIKLPETAGEKKLADRITQSVRTIMDAKVALRSPGLSDGEKDRLNGTVEAHENRIDEAVFALYGVPGLPGA